MQDAVRPYRLDLAFVCLFTSQEHWTNNVYTYELNKRDYDTKDGVVTISNVIIFTLCCIETIFCLVRP